MIGGSNGYGITRFQKDQQLIGITDETNSILKPVTGFGHGYVMVTGMDHGHGRQSLGIHQFQR